MIARKKRYTSSKQRRGAVAVEMAVTSGLVFFFFFAALEFCRVSMLRHSVEQALYEGGRKGIIPGATASAVQTEAQGILRLIGIRSATVSVTPAVIAPDTRDISVRIQLPLDRDLYAPSIFFTGKTLDRTLVLRREGVR